MEFENDLFKQLINALECENIRLIKLLLKSGKLGCNDWIGNSGVTIVHLAVGHGTESFAASAVQELLCLGADPNVPSLDQVTPVHVAAAWGRAAVLHILLTNGGNPWIQDDERRNAFNYAFEAKAWTVVELLHDFLLADKAQHTSVKVKQDTSNGGCVLTEKRFNFLFNDSQNSSLKLELNEDPYSKNISLLTANKNARNSSNLHSVVNNKHCDNSANSSQVQLVQDIYDSLSEELNQTYCVEPCQENDSTECLPLFTSTTEILPVKRKEIFIEPECEERDNSVNLPTNNFKIETPILSKLSDDTYNLERNKPPKIAHSCIFAELLEAVKRRTERLKNLHSEEKHVHADAYSNSFSDYCLRDLKQSLFENSEIVKKESESSISDVKPYTPVSLTERNEETSESNGEVTLLVLESNEKLQVVDISDSGSSFLSLTDNTTSSLTSSDSYQSCSDSPSNCEKERGKEEKEEEEKRIREGLRSFGVDAGPITHTTKAVYLRILNRLRERGAVAPITPPPAVAVASPIAGNATSFINSYCPELQEVISNVNMISEYAQLEYALRKDFDSPGKNWRGGNSKTSFNYLLLDGRKTRNLPERASSMSSSADVANEFLNAVFYIGKGQGNRPYSHLQGAFQSWQHGSQPKDPKEAVILDIWRSGSGVVCLLIFHNTIPAEAFTREAAMIEALGRHHVRNLRRGEYYGQAAHWSAQDRRKLGAYLLLTSKDILLRDGERVLRPRDL